MKSLYIPQELLSTFLSTSKNQKEWSDPSFLLGILSPTDVAFYIHANMVAHDLVGTSLTQSFPNEVVLSGQAVLAKLADDSENKEARTAARELNRLCQSDVNKTNDMVPSIAYYNGQYVAFTLSAAVDEVDPIVAIVDKLQANYTMEELSTLPIFGEYLTRRQKNVI